MTQYIGTVSGWATFIVLIAVARIMLKGGTGTAVSGLQATNQELVRQLEAAKVVNHTLEKQVAELRGAKDVSVAILPVLNALENHETRATERSIKFLGVLDLIAERLGPETE